ncbi:Acetyltransferase (GNAT) domain-containing protein [Salinihabitans flavidus]|uniref:Acetyltransferase (GNAT) domain-containing protein n=1 Tax=Salinihabitans flavidus TaxID=569882 RepID=A0A1H8MCB2_9RHOB|nr:GNAT family N-acetyltransferase [Salinihabitans flavidus]SEO14900.1 Acetyltransferase (GNAT) domain-containing protein [Salinihabitans flavidus]
MADIEPASLLGPDEAAACLPLSHEPGWNQTEADWTMMLKSGHALTVRDGDRRPRASAVALPMGDKIGWISMVLVTAALQRRGIAQRLVGDCIDWHEARCLAPHLDATPAGQPLYRRMGFQPLCGLMRLTGVGGLRAEEIGLRTAKTSDLDWILPLDQMVFGGDRSYVLNDLLARPGAVALVRADSSGFVLSRKGLTATQIGPLIAPDTDTALELLVAALGRIEGPVMVDAFDDHPAIATLLKARGFREQRPFLRMARGLSAPLGDPARLFAAAGPELG